MNSNNKPRFSIKNVMIVVALIAVPAAVVAITSPGYVERLVALIASLGSLIASLGSLALIVRDRDRS